MSGASTQTFCTCDFVYFLKKYLCDLENFEARRADGPCQQWYLWLKADPVRPGLGGCCWDCLWALPPPSAESGPAPSTPPNPHQAPSLFPPMQQLWPQALSSVVESSLDPGLVPRFGSCHSLSSCLRAVPCDRDQGQPLSLGVWAKAKKGHQLGPGEAALGVWQGLPSPLQACGCCLGLRATSPGGLLWSPRQGASP